MRSWLSALLTLARRNIGRSRWRSLLIVAVVALPVAGMVGVATVLQTTFPNPQRTTAVRMGAADLLVYANTGGNAERLRNALPAGSRIEPVLSTSGELVLTGYEVPVTVTSADLDGLARGMLDLVAGRLPKSPDEVAISASVAKLTGTAIGDRVTIRELGARTVVGLIENPLSLSARVVLTDPSLAVTATAPGEAGWLVGLPRGTDPQALEIVAMGVNETGLPPDTSDPEFRVTTRAEAMRQASNLGPTTIVLGGLALVDAALVAAAAFAVGVRRRQRELGLLAATGASPRQLAASVLAEGVLLGGIGSLLGAALGIAGTVALFPFLDKITDRRNPALVLDLPTLAVAVGMGLVAALLAALAPAWSAARTSVLTALSGRRPPSGPAHRSLAVGIVVLGIAALFTALGAALRLQESATESLRTLSLLLLLGGAVLGTLGLGAFSPWLLERLEAPAARLPAAPRIALRDTARARSRNGPIVTALLAAAGATVAVAAYQASANADALRAWQPSLRSDQIMIAGAAFAQAGPEAVVASGAIGGGSIDGVVGDDRAVWIAAGDNGASDPLSTGWVAVADDRLLAALGLESARDDLVAGNVVFLWPRSVDVRSATIHVIRRSDGEEVDQLVVPARVIATAIAPGELPGALVAEATIASFGLHRGRSDAAPSGFLIRLGHPVGDADLAAVGAVAAGYPDTFAFASRPPDLTGGLFRLALIAGSLLFTLSVTGVAVALGEAESRSEQRTLLAIGADPRMRRRISAARAGVIALLGGLLAVPAGLLPVWGLLASRGAVLAVPLPEIVAMVVGLPLLAIAATWVLGRPIPAWNAFRSEGE